ncbi:MAG: hypothetical protein WD029_01310 [Microthrixaceae bacterium]
MSETFNENEPLEKVASSRSRTSGVQQFVGHQAVSAQQVVGALTEAVPLLVNRSIRQIELAGSLLMGLTCHVTARGQQKLTVEQLHAAGAVQPEPLDVLDVLQSDPPEQSKSSEAREDAVSAMTSTIAPTAPEPILVEAELGVPDYDSLAASQVVPRLAMLSSEDLAAILAYEQSHRRRQTIMNRAIELMESYPNDPE